MISENVSFKELPGGEPFLTMLAFGQAAHRIVHFREARPRRRSSLQLLWDLVLLGNASLESSSSTVGHTTVRAHLSFTLLGIQADQGVGDLYRKPGHDMLPPAHGWGADQGTRDSRSPSVCISW